MLSRFLIPLIPSLYVAIVALPMIGRPSPFAVGQVLGRIVLFTEHTLAPSRVATRIQRELPAVKQHMVSVAGAHHQVLRAVVGSDAIEVVDFLSASQEATESTFSHQRVLSYISAVVGSRVVGRFLVEVSATRADDTTLPVRVQRTRSTRIVISSEALRFALKDDASFAAHGALRNRCRQPATALTKARRIYHSCAPNVCAVTAYQSNIFGGYSLA